MLKLSNSSPSVPPSISTNERINTQLLEDIGIEIPRKYPYPGGFRTFWGYLGYGEASSDGVFDSLVGRMFDRNLRIGDDYVVAIYCNTPVECGSLIITPPSEVTLLPVCYVEARREVMRQISVYSVLTGARLPMGFS